MILNVIQAIPNMPNPVTETEVINDGPEEVEHKLLYNDQVWRNKRTTMRQ